MLIILLFCIIEIAVSQISSCIGYSSGSSNSDCRICESGNYLSNSFYKVSTTFKSSDCVARTNSLNQIFYFDQSSLCSDSCDATTLEKSPKTFLSALKAIDATIKKHNKDSKIEIQIASDAIPLNSADLEGELEIYFFRAFQGEISIKPRFCTSTITTKCINQGKMVKFILQTDAFHFFSSGKISFESIEFDGSDLHAPDADAIRKNDKIDCILTEIEKTEGSPCALKGKTLKKPSTDNRISFFNLEPLLDTEIASEIILSNVVLTNINAIRENFGFSSVFQFFHFQKCVLTLKNVKVMNSFFVNGILKLVNFQSYFTLNQNSANSKQLQDTVDAAKIISISFDSSEISGFNRFAISYPELPNLFEIKGKNTIFSLKNSKIINSNLFSKGNFLVDFLENSGNSSFIVNGLIFDSVSSAFAFSISNGKFINVAGVNSTKLDIYNSFFEILNCDFTLKDSHFNGSKFTKSDFLTLDSKEGKTSKLTFDSNSFSGISDVKIGLYLIKVKSIITGITGSQLVETGKLISKKTRDEIIISKCHFNSSNFLFLRNDNFIFTLDILDSLIEYFNLTMHSTPFIELTIEKIMTFKNLTIDNLYCHEPVFLISYGRNFSLDNFVFKNSIASNNFFYYYVIARIDPNNVLNGDFQNIKFLNVTLKRKPSNPNENIRFMAFSPYNKGFGLFRVRYINMEIREFVNEVSKTDFIFVVSSGHCEFRNIFIESVKNIVIYKFFSRLPDSTFDFRNITSHLEKYKIDAIIQVTSAYYLTKLTIVDNFLFGNISIPIKEASLIDFQAVGKLEFVNVNISNFNMPKGTAVSLILDDLPGTQILNTHFSNNRGTGDNGADFVLEMKNKKINTKWETEMVKVSYGIQNSTFKGSSSSISLLDGSELLLHNVSFLDLEKGPVLNIGANSNVYLRNFTLQNIKNSESGGVFIMSSTHFTITLGSITSVNATNKGGVFLIDKQSIIDINEVNIKDSASEYGGLIFSEDSKIKIRNSVFEDSKANQEGGHFFTKTTDFDMDNVQLKQGKASTAGCIFGRFSQFSMNNVIMDNCQSSVETGFGNFYILGLPTQISTFRKFSCINSIAMTGACLIIKASNATFEDSQFINNTSTKQHIFDFQYTEVGKISFSSCKFTKNSGNMTISKSKNAIMEFKNVEFNDNVVQKGQFFIVIEGKSTILEKTIFISSEKKNLNSFSQYIFQFLSLDKIEIKSITFNGIRNLAFSKFENSKQITIENSKFENGLGFNGSVLYSLESNVSISNSEFRNNEARFSGSVFSENSHLFIKICVFTENYAAIEGSDISVLNSKNLILLKYNTTILNTSSTGFKSSAIYAVNDQMIIEEVKFIDSYTNTDGKGFYFVNCFDINITNASLSKIFSSGAIKIYNERPVSSRVNISNSQLINCTNSLSGGFIAASGVISVNLTKVLFEGGVSNNSGGAIFCNGQQCAISINEGINFTRNTATQIGGAIYSNQKSVSILTSTLVLENNTATIGNNIYSLTNSLLVISQEEFKLVFDGCLSNKNGTKCTIRQFMKGTKEFSTKSGQSFSFGVLLIDPRFNLMESESETVLEVLTENNITLEGYYSKISKGMALFPDFSVVGETNLTYNLQIQFKKGILIVKQQIKVKIEKCGRGEYFSESRCNDCPTSFYSLSYIPEEKKIRECKKCEENAECQGRDALTPNPGFWRENENSTLILKCLFGEEACPKQNLTNPFNYKCGPKYQGNICLNCAKKHGKTSRGCAKCSEEGLAYFLFFFKLIVMLGLMVFESHIAMYLGNNLTKSLLRTIYLHNAYWIIITDGGKVDTSMSDALTSSFGFLNDHFSAAPKDVFNFYCFLEGLGGPNEIFEANLVLQNIIPLIFSVLAFILTNIIDIILGKFKASKSKMKHIFYSFFVSLIISHRNWYPRILNSISSIFKCKKIGLSNDTYLQDNPDLKCGSSLHNKLIASIIIPSIIGWCVIVPIIIFYFIFSNKVRILKKRDTFKSVITRKLTGGKVANRPSGIPKEENATETPVDVKLTKKDSIFFYLVYDYKPHFYYWYGVEILLVFGLSLLSQIFNEVNYTVKNLIIFIGIAILFLIYQKLLVFDLDINNQVASSSIGVILFSIVILIIGANKENSEGLKQTCMVFMILANMIFFVICILLILFKKAKVYLSKIGTFLSGSKSLKSMKSRISMKSDKSSESKEPSNK